jgi:hypothetical protein
MLFSPVGGWASTPKDAVSPRTSNKANMKKNRFDAHIIPRMINVGFLLSDPRRCGWNRNRPPCFGLTLKK